MNGSKQVKITVATLSDSHTDTFDVEQKLQDVRDKAFPVAGYQSGPRRGLAALV